MDALLPSVLQELEEASRLQPRNKGAMKNDYAEAKKQTQKKLFYHAIGAKIAYSLKIRA